MFVENAECMKQYQQPNALTTVTLTLVRLLQASGKLPFSTLLLNPNFCNCTNSDPSELDKMKELLAKANFEDNRYLSQ